MPRNLRRLLVALVVANLLVLVWYIVFPHDPELALYSHLMQGLDDNHDGRLSRDEFTRHLGDAAAFERYDLNHDGVLDVSEFRNAVQSEDPDPPSKEHGPPPGTR